jgi:hypothetical protein
MTYIKTYRDHLLEHPMMGPEAALMQEVKELRAALTEAQRDADRYRWLRRNQIELSLSHQATSMLIADQAELDAAMKGAA